jgi:hypothetical protein
VSCSMSSRPVDGPRRAVLDRMAATQSENGGVRANAERAMLSLTESPVEIWSTRGAQQVDDSASERVESGIHFVHATGTRA